MFKEQYKKYKKHSKLIQLGENFDPLVDLNFEIFEDIEIPNRGFTYNLIVPFLKGKSSYFNLGYLNASFVPKEKFYMSWAERKSLGLNDDNKDGFIDYHIDKPKIDFIRVFEPYQRNGIAEQMILKAAEYYADSGLKFYFSNLNDRITMQPLKEKMIRKYDFIKEERSDYHDKIRHYFDLE